MTKPSNPGGHRLLSARVSVLIVGITWVAWLRLAYSAAFLVLLDSTLPFWFAKQEPGIGWVVAGEMAVLMFITLGLAGAGVLCIRRWMLTLSGKDRIASLLYGAVASCFWVGGLALSPVFSPIFLWVSRNRW